MTSGKRTGGRRVAKSESAIQADARALHGRLRAAGPLDRPMDVDHPFVVPFARPGIDRAGRTRSIYGVFGDRGRE